MADGGTRGSWLDDDGGVAIDEMARRLDGFIDAMKDGIISEGEISAQESRLADIMREVEPLLSDEQHAKVTQLLCELTAFDIMQMLHMAQASRPKTTFRG
jgi:hypothetical protein